MDAMRNKPGRKAEWQQRLVLPVTAGRVMPEVPERKRSGRVRVLTDEERAARRRASNAKFAAKLKERKAAERVAAGLPADHQHGTRTPLEGRVFGMLTVRSFLATVGKPGRRKAMWTVDCACGKVLSLRSDQMLAKYGRKHCGCARGLDLGTTERRPGDAPKRGGSGRLNPVRKGRKAKGARPPRELSPAEEEERDLQAAERMERRRLLAENRARAARGESWVQAPGKVMDAAGWVRLLRTMRRSGARWGDLTLELESAAAYGVTREMVEEMK